LQSFDCKKLIIRERITELENFRGTRDPTVLEGKHIGYPHVCMKKKAQRGYTVCMRPHSTTSDGAEIQLPNMGSFLSAKFQPPLRASIFLMGKS
jgi:hypothetical protein